MAVAAEWERLSALPPEPAVSRDRCTRCGRPKSACWCSGLPLEPLLPSCRLIVLQHPAEERRRLRTAPMLSLSLAAGRCVIFRGKRFPASEHVGLADILASPNAVLLYPSDRALDLRQFETVAERHQPYDVVVLDGTWPQARAMLAASPVLRRMQHAKVVGAARSQYVIRTQPADGCLSTLETAAEALAYLEGDDRYAHALLAPLHALCAVQLANGAVTHDSKQTKRLVSLLDPSSLI